jgi:hypothetical protein
MAYLGCIEFWRGLHENGGPISKVRAELLRPDPVGADVRTPAFAREQVGFFITAGDARNNGPTATKERSNVVMVSFPRTAAELPVLTGLRPTRGPARDRSLASSETR